MNGISVWTRARKPRRIVLGLLAAGVIFALAVPSILSTRSLRGRVLAVINARVAPSRVEFERISLSWFAPTEFRSLRIYDDRGERVILTPRARWDQSLFRAIFQADKPSTFRFEKTLFDARRSKDGRIDIADALAPFFREKNPRKDLVLDFSGSSLTFRDPGLAEPVRLEDLSLKIHIAPLPRPLVWTAQARSVAEGGRTLTISGSVDRWRAISPAAKEPDLSVAFRSDGLPLRLNVADTLTSCALEGGGTIQRVNDAWISSGRLRSESLDVENQGKSSKFAAVSTDWSVSRALEGWSIDRLNLESELGSILGQGEWPPTSDSAKLSANLKLDRVAAAFPNLASRTLGADVLGGLLKVEVAAGPNRSYAIDARLIHLDLTREGVSIPLPSPISFEAGIGRAGAGDAVRLERAELRVGEVVASLAGEYDFLKDLLEVERLDLKSPYVATSAKGRVSSMLGDLSLDFSGRVEPNWQALTERLRDGVEPGARISGESRDFSISLRPKSSSDASWLSRLTFDAGLTLSELDVYGLRFGRVPIAVHGRDGSIVVEPIRTALNGGSLSLDPVIDLKSPDGPKLLLSKETHLEGAEVNDEVSHRYLSYTAPILDRATRVRGKLSAAVDRAEFPLASTLGKRAEVEGTLLFQDVRFAPGPLAEDILKLIGKSGSTGLRLNDPVIVRIADGKIHQTGLALPIGDVTRVELEGWVDFDRNIALKVAIPVTSAMMLGNPLLSSITAGTKIEVPISGTLDKRKIDMDAMKSGLKETGKSLLSRAATFGLGDLVLRLARPKAPREPVAGEPSAVAPSPPPSASPSPAAPKPPKMTPAERRAKRALEKARKKAERSG